ncbi:MAG TPA: ATP-binding protein [Ktedonobacteraceae bacterium]|jgi:hypothetical protein
MVKKQTSDDRSRYAHMSKEERLQSFKRTIAHPHLKAADQELREAIRETGGASIVNVFGPARVGKTTMKNHVMKTILTEAFPTLQHDREQIPILSIAPKPPLTGSFNWKTFFQLGLSALQEPLIEAKMLVPLDDQEEPLFPTLSAPSWNKQKSIEGTKDALRHAFEIAIQRRRPVAVIIDEAQHLGKVSGAKHLQNQLDCIKSLADTTETVFVLIGTYELLPLRNLSAQLIGRSLDIHFPRYRSTPKELSHFKKVLETFQDALPFESETNVLLENWELCYERSIGCVGNLRLMLVRAVHAALWQEAKTVSVNHLKQHAFSEAECYEMMREAYEGERELKAKVYQRTQFLEMLGLERAGETQKVPHPSPLEASLGGQEDFQHDHGDEKGTEVQQNQHIEQQTGAPSPPEASPKKSPSRPFRRKPHRDPTGTDPLDALSGKGS